MIAAGCAVLLALSAQPAPAVAPATPLIPRALFFGAVQAVTPKISPDGKQLGWRAVDDKGVLQLWVQPVPSGDKAQVTQGGERPVLDFAWAEDSTTLLYLQDVDGDGLSHLFALDLTAPSTRDLTPWKGVRARLLGTSQKVPDQVLALLNQRDPKAFDVVRISLKTGSIDVDTRNPGDAFAFAADESLLVRALLARLPDASLELRVRDTVKVPWRSLMRVTANENLALLGFALDGKGVYLASSSGTDTTRIVEKQLKTGVERNLASSPGSDVRDFIYNPWKMAVQAAAFERAGRLEWAPIEGSVIRDLELLATATAPAVFRVISRDRADALWLVELDADRASKKIWLWDRASKKGTAIFTEQPKLEGAKLAEQKPVTVTTRDGTVLPALLTLPVTAPAKSPLVLLVRESVEAAERWGYDPRAQFLASRGYAVLQVNFRGTFGFGKRFYNLGNRDWGRHMQDDLSDAVAWAVKEGVADPKRVAIVGRGYGGYAALMGLAMTPELFRCGVAGFAPVDLTAWVRASAPTMKAMIPDWQRRLGDVDNAADRARLDQASPVGLADRIQAPVLVAQSSQDPQLKPTQALLARVEKAAGTYTLLTYDSEKIEDALDFRARVEAFLAQCLGGRAEPLPKEGKIAGSSVQVTMSAKPAAAPVKR